MPSDHYNIAIAGGGPAGALCAIRLARLGWRVLLADKSPAAPLGAPFPEMLSPGACRLLTKLEVDGAWGGEASVECPGVLSFWNRNTPELSNFALTQLCQGRVLDRAKFDANLRGLAISAGVGYKPSTRLSCHTNRDVSVERLQLRQQSASLGTDCTADFFVEASGRNPVAGRAGDNCVSRIFFDRLIAIQVPAPTATGDQPPWFHIIASSNGWWYRFAHRSHPTWVFLTDADLFPRDVAHRQDFLHREWRELGDYVGNLPALEVASARIRDARTSCRSVLWRNRWMPLGDASFTLDPLSGSGLNRAFRAADRAADAIDSFLRTGSTSLLSEDATETARDFTACLSEGARHYTEAATQFPESAFWRRRSRLV